MYETLAKLGYTLKGFIQKDEDTYIVMGEKDNAVLRDRAFATWEYGDGLYWGHYDLEFNEARHDMAKRAGLAPGELESGIVVQRFKTDDQARKR